MSIGIWMTFYEEQLVHGEKIEQAWERIEWRSAVLRKYITPYYLHSVINNSE
jgi:hypothetical protein